MLKKYMKKRKGGFTLVELLIVIMIIAILAGMMMLATGSATDTANATRVINDLRTVKGAALQVCLDGGHTMKDIYEGFTSATGVDSWLAFVTGMDKAMDHPLFSGGQGDGVYFLSVFEAQVQMDSGGTATRYLLGFDVNYQYNPGYLKPDSNSGVLKKLAERAETAGLYDENGDLFTENSDYVCIAVQ